MNPIARAKLISNEIGRNYKMPPPPTVGTRIAGGSAITFTRFRNTEAKRGLSQATDRDPGFIFNVPVISARYPIVSINGRSQSVVQDPGKVYLFDRSDRTRVSLETIHDSVVIIFPLDTIEFFARERELGHVAGLRAREMGQADSVLYHMALALVHGSDEKLAWSLPMRRSDSTNGSWLRDTDHAIEDMDGDSDFAALSVI